MSVEPIHLAKAISLTHACQLVGVSYKFGAKIPLDAAVGNFHAVDCSGFVRWLVHNATDPALIIPDGSAQQHAFARDHLKLIPVHYSPMGKSLVLAFIEPTNAHPGHVWAVAPDGYTMESHGGKGVDRRHWDTPVLKAEVAAAYVWLTI